jgi:sugar/nucleoside kinase (ribokinase family)
VRVPAAWRVEGVQTTGAGDMFTACYAAHRAAGAETRRAVELASDLVARQLEQRLRSGSVDPAQR